MIRILCNECHSIYDKVEKENLPIDTLSNRIDNGDETNINENMIKKGMNKSKAIQLAWSANLTSITNSNINAAQDVWWREPNNNRFKTDLYIILNDSNSKTLYIFKLPGNTIKIRQVINISEHYPNFLFNINSVCLPHHLILGVVL